MSRIFRILLWTAVADLRHLLFNARVDIVVVTAFLTFVTIIILGCALEWWRILSGAKKAVLHETPYVPLEPSDALRP